jgi:uncharacterized Zn finger protein
VAVRRRSWDDPWQKYPASVPLSAEDGIATTKQRGVMAESWWSQRLVAALESYGLGARMKRGRRYARQGQIVSFRVDHELLVAQVQGSRPTPYVVTVKWRSPDDEQWRHVEQSMRSRVAFAARLLAGELPAELEAVFEAVGVSLLPPRWSVLNASCTCPDWENPCKHIAAVLYVFADQLDVDPWLLLLWRGRSKDELLGALRRTEPAPIDPSMPPWWPLVPGARLPEPATDDVLLVDAPINDPAAALARCERLAVDVGGTAISELLRPSYATVVDPDVATRATEQQPMVDRRRSKASKASEPAELTR